MTRREILQMMLAAPIAATLDVEKLLWIPGQMVTVPAMPVPTKMVAFMYGGTQWIQIQEYDIHYLPSGFKMPPGLKSTDVFATIDLEGE